MNNVKMLYFDRNDALKELVLLKQVHRNSVIFVTIGIFKQRVYVSIICM